MSADKLETAISVLLLITGAASYNMAEFVTTADIYVTFVFHIISALSVFMVVALNRKKFITEVKSWFK